MKKLRLKKLLSLCAGFMFALVAVVALTAPNKISANAEEQLFNVVNTTPYGQTPAVSMEEFEAQGWKRPEVGQKLGKNFVIRKSTSLTMTIISTNYIIYGKSAEASLYIAELAVPGSAKSPDLTGVELLNTQKLIFIGDYSQVEFELLIDFGDITFVDMIPSDNLLLYKVDDGTETPDDETEEPTIPDDGTETPDDGTETPDDGTEEPKDATTDKVAEWLNNTFGFNTNGNVVGIVAMMLAGVFVIKIVFGRK